METTALVGGSEIAKSALRQIKKWDKVDMALAWAQAGTPLHAALCGNLNKLGSVVVGFAGGFTEPKFLTDMPRPKVRVYCRPGTLFHPKVMLFTGRTGWAAIVGSANATRAGLSRDEEAAVLVEGTSTERDLRDKLADAISKWWDAASPVDAEVFALVGEAWSRRPRGDGRPTRRTLTEIGAADWTAYSSSILDEDSDAIGSRLRVLRWAKANREVPFDQLAQEDRQKMLGTIVGGEQATNFQYFCRSSIRQRSLSAALGLGARREGERTRLVARALMAVPTTGEVRRPMFERFVELWTRATGTSGVSVASRLLVMRRPDTFLCLTNPNRTQFCSAYGVPVHKTVHLADYWENVIEPIRRSPWWHSPEPERGLAKDLWRGRVAMLDARFYRP